MSSTIVETIVGGSTTRGGGRPSPSSRWSHVATLGLPVIALAVAVLIPVFIDERFRLQVLTLAFLNASLVAGLTISLGYAGLLNLSQGSFYGIGAYATAYAVTEHTVPLELALLLALVLGAVGGVVLGLASLRVRGDYFALVSLAFTMAMFHLMNNWTAITRGREGFYGIPIQTLLGFRLASAEATYYACLGLLVVVCIVVSRFSKTYAARAMLAVRFDEPAARMMGINVGFTKLLAMGLSGGLAGLAGGVLTATVLIVTPNSFSLTPSFTVMLWVIVGGMTSLVGSVVVAGSMTVLMEAIRPLHQLRLAVIGVVVLTAVMYRGGVFGDWWAGRRRPRWARAKDRAS